MGTFISDNDIPKYSQTFAERVWKEWYEKHPRATDFITNLYDIDDSQMVFLIRLTGPRWTHFKGIAKWIEKERLYWLEDDEYLTDVGQKEEIDFQIRGKLLDIRQELLDFARKKTENS